MRDQITDQWGLSRLTPLFCSPATAGRPIRSSAAVGPALKSLAACRFQHRRRSRDVITPVLDSTPERDLKCFFRSIPIPTPLHVGSNSRLEPIPLMDPIHIKDALPVLEPISLYAKHTDMSKC